MKNARFVKICLPLLCAVCLLIHSTEGRDFFPLTGFWTTTLTWDGGKSECGKCMQGTNLTNDFACSNGNGDWNGGRNFFLDGIPANSRAVRAQVMIEYSMGYTTNKTLESSAIVLLQGKTVGVAPIFPHPNNTCPNCMEDLAICSSMEFGLGWPGYNYTGMNEIYVLITQGFICVSKVHVKITYAFNTQRAVLTTLQPDLGPTYGNTSVTISGYHFHQGLSCIFNNSWVVTATLLDKSTINCMSPPSVQEGMTEVGVTGISPALDAKPLDPSQTLYFYYYKNPNITSVDPTEGYQSGDTPVTIKTTGHVKSDYLTCRFGTHFVPATYLDDQQLLCHSPPGLGNVSLSISLNGLQFTDSVPFLYKTKSPDPEPAGDSFWEKSKEWIILGICGFLLVSIFLVSIVWSRRRARKLAKDLLFSSGQWDGPTPTAFQGRRSSVEISFHDLKFGNRIGRGSAGDVFKGVWCGTEVAIKMLPAHQLGNFGIEDLLQEAAIMKTLRHPNVLQYLGACTQPPNVCIITEFMPLGSIYRLIHNEQIPFPWIRIKNFCIDATRGLSYLHNFKPPIIHRDLKSHNLLVDRSWRVKVCDFGLSRIVDVQKTMTACGTPCWTAPEVMRRQYYTVKADVYSLGIVFWELLTREDPYTGMDAFNVVLSVGTKGLRPTIPPSCPPSFATLIEECWSEDPDARPPVDEILDRLEVMRFPTTPGPSMMGMSPRTVSFVNSIQASPKEEISVQVPLLNNKYAERFSSSKSEDV